MLTDAQVRLLERLFGDWGGYCDDDGQTFLALVDMQVGGIVDSYNMYDWHLTQAGRDALAKAKGESDE